MSNLSNDDVKHIAKLSKLQLKDEEIIKFQKQLSDIVTFVDSLKEVDVTGIEPTSQTTGLTNVYSKDEVKIEDVLDQDKTLSGTDNSHNGYFKVPAILTDRTDK